MNVAEFMDFIIHRHNGEYYTCKQTCYCLSDYLSYRYDKAVLQHFHVMELVDCYKLHMKVSGETPELTNFVLDTVRVYRDGEQLPVRVIPLK